MCQPHRHDGGEEEGDRGGRPVDGRKLRRGREQEILHRFRVVDDRRLRIGEQPRRRRRRNGVDPGRLPVGDLRSLDSANSAHSGGGGRRIGASKGSDAADGGASGEKTDPERLFAVCQQRAKEFGLAGQKFSAEYEQQFPVGQGNFIGGNGAPEKARGTKQVRLDYLL